MNFRNNDSDVTWGNYVGLGLEFAAVFLFFTGGGYLIDYWQEMDSHLFLFIGLFAGLAASFYYLLRRVSELQKQGEEQDRKFRERRRSIPESNDERINRLEREIDETARRIGDASRRYPGRGSDSNEADGS